LLKQDSSNFELMKIEIRTSGKYETKPVQLQKNHLTSTWFRGNNSNTPCQL
jgi:hypothetical protein